MAIKPGRKGTMIGQSPQQRVQGKLRRPLKEKLETQSDITLLYISLFHGSPLDESYRKLKSRKAYSCGPYGSKSCCRDQSAEDSVMLQTQMEIIQPAFLSTCVNRIALSIYNTHNLYYSCEINLQGRQQLFLNCLDLFFLCKSSLVHVFAQIKVNLNIFKRRTLFYFQYIPWTVDYQRQVKLQYFATV